MQNFNFKNFVFFVEDCKKTVQNVKAALCKTTGHVLFPDQRNLPVKRLAQYVQPVITWICSTCVSGQGAFLGPSCPSKHRAPVLTSVLLDQESLV